jgi:pimeloyl-ACP methyl ester carboxylesterase
MKTGSSRRLPIVLIHGFPFDGGMWEHQAAFLQTPEGGGFHVLAPDLPGFGTAPLVPAPAPEQASIESFAEEVHQLIRHRGGRAVVGGFSMGGYVLLALLRAFPQDVAGAMFISTRADADSPEARAGRLKSIDDIRARGTAGLVDAMTTRLLGPNAGPEIREPMRALMSRQSPDGVIAAQSAMARRRDQTDLLPQLAIPTLIIAGSQDAVTPLAVPRAMQALLPACRLVEIAGAGHLTPLEAPRAVAEAMRDFAGAIGKRPSRAPRLA